MDDENRIKAESGEIGPDIDWEEALSLYQSHVDSGNEALIRRDTIKLVKLTKYAPENVLSRAVLILLKLLKQGTFDDIEIPTVHEAIVYCLICFVRKNESLATVLVDLGVGMSILRLLENSDSRLRKLLVKLLWFMLTFESKGRHVLARVGGLRELIALLGSCRDGSRKYLLEILSMLALTQVGRKTLSRFGGIQFLVEAANHGSMISRERACHAIGLLGVKHIGKRMLVELGVVPVLIQLLRDGEQSTKLVAGNALGIFMAHVDHIRRVAEAGAVPLYADLLRGPTSMGREIAEDVFCILSVEEDIAIDVADHLVRILREDNDEVKAAAVDVFWDLAGYKHLSVACSSGAIPIMVDLARNGSTEVKEKVSGAFAQMSYNECDRIALAEAGAIPILINMMGGTNDEMMDNAVEALVNFAEDPVYMNRVSEVLGSPAFLYMRNRVVQNQTSDALIARSFRRLSAQHPDFDLDAS